MTGQPGVQRTDDSDRACRYCKTRLLPVVRGWQCPACRATVGQHEPAAR